MNQNKITEKLEALDFVIGENLYYTNEDSEDAYIHLALEEAEKFEYVKAVYFRRFERY